MSVVAKADICELVGISVNASELSVREGAERALDRVAALGAAALMVAVGADRQGVPAYVADCMVGRAAPDERDRLAAELGQVLWHIRYGAQYSLVPAAVRLLARWLQFRSRFAGFTSEEQVKLLQRFAGRVLHESLSERCLACGGSGKLERSRSGSWIRPRGSMQRNATFRSCTSCHGSGRAVASNAERAKWLQIDAKRYQAERWAQSFEAAQAWLHKMLCARLKKPLTVQLERRTKRD